MWAARYLTMNGRRRLLGSFTHGSMANALPQAIGAQLAHPERQVVSMSGDGGLSMLLGDLLTLRQVGLPVKVVVFNNAPLGLCSSKCGQQGFPIEALISSIRTLRSSQRPCWGSLAVSTSCRPGHQHVAPARACHSGLHNPGRLWILTCRWDVGFVLRSS